MDSITLGQIGAAVTFLVGFLGGVGWLYSTLKGCITDTIKEEIKPLGDKIDRVDKEQTKNFLVRCIADFDHEHDISDTEKERFYEQYERYVAAGGNSYISRKVEQLEAMGKL